MNQTRYANLPVIGRVQHGEQVPTNNGGTRAKELGHFIAKIQQEYMQGYLQEFDKQYKGKKYIEIEFCNDEPLTKKYVRYNQSGEVCSCFEGNTTANQKTKNGVQPIACGPECQYRQKNEQGKSTCNRIGWLKFFIPSICKDRIWLMRITGQTSINRLDSYINLQKAQGNSLKGRFILFLKQEEQTSQATGQSFNNYILDILKKEDFESNKPIPQTQKNQNEVSTTNTQNVNNKVEKQEESVSNTEKTNISETPTKTEDINATQKQEKKEDAPKENKTATKKATKSRTKKTEQKQEMKSQDAENKTENDELKNCYALLSTFNEKLTSKNGETKEYLVAEVADMNDQISNIVIRPEDADELLECELGTIVKLEIKELADKKFAMKLEFVDKRLKNIAA